MNRVDCSFDSGASGKIRSGTCNITWMIIFSFSAMWISGCDNSDGLTRLERRLVAPLLEKVPHSFDGRLGRCWGGDEYEVREGSAFHYIILDGVIGPEPGQPYFHAARKLGRRLYNKQVEVSVNRLDDCQCEYAFLECEGIDLGLKLIESGLGWFDESDCERKEIYIAAQEIARKEKIGLWADDNPSTLR